MSPIEQLKSFPTWVKNTSAVVGLVLTIAGAVMAAEQHFVNKQENIQTLQQLQQNFDSQMKMVQYDFINDQYFKAKNRLRENPSDIGMLEEFQQLKQRRDILRKDLGLQ